MSLQFVSLEVLSEFKDAYPRFLEELASLEGSVAEPRKMGLSDWLQSVMDYNVPNGKFLRRYYNFLGFYLECVIVGKKFRAQLVMAAGTQIYDKELSEEDTKNLYNFAWITEMLQSAGLMADDIMDHSSMRRGQKCWYLLENVGMAAVNDVLALENAAFCLIGRWSEKEAGLEDPRYAKILRVMHDVAFRTCYGQAMDLETEAKKDVAAYTMELYEKIALTKTAYYTFYLPVVIGMIVASKDNEKYLTPTRPILLKVGTFFQIQDDYLDVYGALEAIGKDGTDIANGKCAWPIVKALELADARQRQILVEHYGQNDSHSICRVKQIFGELNIREIFKEFQEQTLTAILQDVEDLPEDFPNTECLARIVRVIFSRSLGDSKVKDFPSRPRSPNGLQMEGKDVLPSRERQITQMA